MTDLHLISSISPSYQHNTRTSFENNIPRSQDLTYTGIYLKEMYFQASFVTVNKQDHPHITFITKSGAEEFDKISSQKSDIGDRLANYKLLSEELEYGTGFRTVFSIYDFGKVKKYIFTDLLMLQIILNPARIEKVEEIINIFNHVLQKNNMAHTGIFFKVILENKIGYKSVNCTTLFDTAFADFLGLEIKNRKKCIEVQLVALNSPIGFPYVTKVLDSEPCFFGLDFLQLQPGRAAQYTHILRSENVLNLTINTPPRVLITCDIVKPQVYNNRLIRYLGMLQLVSNPERLNNYQNYTESSKLVHYRPVQPLILSVKSEDVRSIKIDLVEENQEILKLAVAGPTLVTLTTCQDFRMNTHCIVFSGSNDSESLKLFPQNKANRFQHQLPKELNLKENNLGVQLISISLPRKFFNITSHINSIEVGYETKKDPKLTNAILEDLIKDPNIFTLFPELETRSKLIIKPGHYQNLNDFIENTYETFITAGLELEVKNHHLIFYNNSKDTNVHLSLNGTLAMILGLTIQYSEDLFQFVIEEEFISPYKANLNLIHPDFVLVYADFIDLQIVGGLLAPVLQVVPSPNPDSEETSRMNYDFQDQKITKVCKDVLSSFTIELRNVSGNILEFEPDSYTELLMSFKENS